MVVAPSASTKMKRTYIWLRSVVFVGAKGDVRVGAQRDQRVGAFIRRLVDALLINDIARSHARTQISSVDTGLAGVADRRRRRPRQGDRGAHDGDGYSDASAADDCSE
ncbi:hypothetical protein BKG71_07610 [Mycobacteroides chelonae]|nr:hypothetical protein BKG71_07610 [Mycobacteroides chelonae]OLT77234.1 hypothetical protein BKG57_16675 [Mycobacteroides chelonae]